MVGNHILGIGVNILQPIMRWRSSATADAYLSTADNRCYSMKAKVKKSCRAFSEYRITARRTREEVHRESDGAIWTFICCARRETSEPFQINTSTTPWRVTQGMNSPLEQSGSR